MNPNTSLAATDFTNHNVFTSFGLLAYADGNTDQKAFFSNSNNAEVAPQQIVKAVSTEYPGTNAEIGVLIDRGLFDTLSLVSPTTTSLSVNVQTFPPGPPSQNRTVAAAFGLVFVNGSFITGGQEKSELVPIPEPSTLLLLLGPVLGLLAICYGTRR